MVLTILLVVKIAKQHRDVIRNIATENPSLPAGTMYFWLWLDAYTALITHGNPSPKNTFTELDPVTLPTAESAYLEVLAAVILANVSGREVPTATRVMAVIYGSRLRTHPINSATSPTIPVMTPIMVRATTNAYLPPPHLMGGMKANRSFQL